MRPVGPRLAAARARRAPAICHREHEVVRLEAGRPDDAVDLVQRAVGGARCPSGSIAVDRLGHELDVRPLQRGQEVRAEQHPLAAERVVGPHLLAQPRGPCSCQRMNAAGAHAPSRRPSVRGWRIISVSDSPYSNTNCRRNACRPGTRSIDRFAQRRVGPVAARQEPVAGALEDRQCARPVAAISGTNCTALAPVPTTATRLPARS